MQLIIKVAYWLFAVYAVVAVAAFVLQRRLMYFPDPERVSPASFNLPGVTERVIDTPDGARLIAWYAPPAPGQPTLLYFHGNAGNLASRSERVRRYVQRGYGVLFLSYRSYGGSTGTPSERANVADALLAYQALIKDGIDPERADPLRLRIAPVGPRPAHVAAPLFLRSIRNVCRLARARRFIDLGPASSANGNRGLHHAAHRADDGFLLFRHTLLQLALLAFSSKDLVNNRRCRIASRHGLERGHGLRAAGCAVI
jgi:hypothetical protein